MIRLNRVPALSVPKASLGRATASKPPRGMGSGWPVGCGASAASGWDATPIRAQRGAAVRLGSARSGCGRIFRASTSISRVRKIAFHTCVYAGFRPRARAHEAWSTDMADDESRTVAAILADITSLDRAIALHEEGRRMGYPGSGEPFVAKKMHERRAELLEELAQHEPPRPHRRRTAA